MPIADLPHPIETYFAAKEGKDAEGVLACFAEDATVWDNGEDLVLNGAGQIRDWMTERVAGYNLTSDIKFFQSQEDGYLVKVVVAGDFPGSPYEFSYRFKLQGGQIQELAIDPIGSLA